MMVMADSKSKKKKKALTIQDMAQIALKDLLPQQEKQNKEPYSKKLKNLLNRIPKIPLQKLEKWKDEVFELGRSEGFDDMLIGKWVRKAMDEAEYSERHILRILPDTAKQQQQRVKQTETEQDVTNDAKDDKMSTSAQSVTESSETEQEDTDERPEIYQIPLQDARPEDVEKYDVPALKRLLKEALIRIDELETQIRKTLK